MKSFITALLVAIFVAIAMAASTDDQKPIIVSYPKGTPYSEMEELKAEIKKVVS